MEIKVGDKVRYLNAKGGGVVSKIIDYKMVEVLDESGFEIPFQKNELVVIPSENASVSKTGQAIPEPKPITKPESVVPKFIPKETEEEIPGNDLPKLYFATVPVGNKLDMFDLYLINDCNYHFLYSFCSKQKKQLSQLEINTVEANTKVHVTTVSKEKLHDVHNFVIQGVFFKNKDFVQQMPVQKEISLPIVKLYKDGCFKGNDFFDEKALIELLYERTIADELEKFTDKDFSQVVSQKESQPQKFQASKKENKEMRNFIKEVDLHIHELVENEQGLTPGDKLQIQLETFDKELNKAIVEHINKIVFIHGVGNGVLKLKITNTLDRKYPHLKYQDASFQKYKFGATLITIS